MKGGHPAQEVVVGVQVSGRLGLRPGDLGFLQPGSNGGHCTCRHLVLKVEYVHQVAIEAVGPEMRARCRINELSRDSHSAARLTNASFENIAHAELAPD